jgi:hypothetical protein
MARDIGARVNALAERMTPDSQVLVRQMALDLHRQLVAAKGDTPSVRALVQQATDTLAAQEIESAERVLGDHGVHHLEGDYRMAMETLQAKGPVTAADRAATMLAAIYHDTGYLTDPARQWQDPDHPHWSTQFYDAKVKPLVSAALGKKTADELSTTIATHADTDMDWEQAPRTSAFRLADNLALFHKEKIPALFRNIPENRVVMEQWANGGMDTETARKTMQANVQKSMFSPFIKRQLMRATEEVNDGLPKFLAGMWSGEVSGIEWDKAANAPIVRVTNKGNTALMKRLDLGQKQFAKLAKTFGVTLGSFNQSPKVDFKKGEKTLLRLMVRGRALKEAFRQFLREFNRCHEPGGSGKGGQFASGPCEVHISPGEVQHTKVQTWGGTEDRYWVKGKGRTSAPEFSSSPLDASALHGKPLTPEEFEALPGRMLYHVTTDLEGVRKSGRLIASIAQKERGMTSGLGGGSYPQVSLTYNKVAARNIFTCLKHAQAIAKGADFEMELMKWANEESQHPGVDGAKLKTAVMQATIEYERYLTAGMKQLSGGDTYYSKTYGGANGQSLLRLSAAKDAFRTYVGWRESAGAGPDPIMFTDWEKLARTGTVAILAFSQKQHKEMTKQVVVTTGTDQFQQEIAVHGDVPVGKAFYFTTLARPKRVKGLRK